MIENIFLLAAYLSVFFALMLCGALFQIAIVIVTHYFPRSKFAQWAEARDYENVG